MKTLLLCCLGLLLFSKTLGQSLSDSVHIPKDIRYKFDKNKTYLPVLLMFAGAVSDGNGRKDVKETMASGARRFSEYQNSVDDYAQFLPFAGLYAFEWLGMTPRTDWKNRTAIIIKAQIMNLGMIHLLKSTLNHQRPDGSAYSFPSGHTANVFAGAALVSIEYGQHHPWVPYAAYGVASGVGVMRMINNKHYISDVLFGAGLGILSARLAYWTHQYKWNKPKSTTDPFDGVVYHSNNLSPEHD
ncbi:MAG: phosphatase PAP2 family protein [Chryseobacterium sp.]|nr:phosphatase PAP2 family protein [Chryseobacterium sp.]